MPLSAGTRLGPYEILAPIGAGGMGEVYRARDSRLKRDVALKVLPEAFVNDPGRMARFQREAEVLASLNHPNIAHVYGVEDRALAMELVEGDSPRGPMPFDEAWKIALQIGDALDYAHERGVIHRDLKPANVKVTPDGVVKLLDFGLAKAFSGTQDSASFDPGNSPTVTLGATVAGTIMGTAAYMAPEQAKGKKVDKRADIWSFGVVLYELLTGERMFRGEDVPETLAQVLASEPDLEKAPPQVRKLLRRCLEKDPKLRLRDTGDARYMLEPQSAATAAAIAPSPSWLAVGALAAAGVLAVALGAISWSHFREVPPSVPAGRFDVVLRGEGPAMGYFALSPDGRNLAYSGNDGSARRIWVRPLDSLEARVIPGTDDATYPFWSPDGQNLGFFAQGKLKRIAITGGPSQALANAPTPRGAAWNREGTIVFAPNVTGGLFRVPEEGGEAVKITNPDAQAGGSGNNTHRYPEFILGGKNFLFTYDNGRENLAGIYAASVDGKAPVRILPDNSRGLYVPPSSGKGPGYIVFRRENTLMALPFDPEKLRAAGPVIPLAENVDNTGNTGFGAFAASQSGVLLYRSANARRNRKLVWLDRSGKPTDVTSDPEALAMPALSPDGKRAAVSITASTGNADIWLRDLKQGVQSRFTFAPGSARAPVWSPDGSYLVYVNLPSGATFDLYRKSADGSGKEELLLRAGINGYPQDISPDGKMLVYTQTGVETKADLWLLPLTGEPKPIKFLESPYDELNAQFSPDGKWMAYDSNESGQTQVYVQPIPATGAKRQISPAGGTHPRWSRDGKELFYLSPDAKMMAVPIKLGATFESGAPRALFSNAPAADANFETPYQPSPDGKRFLAVVQASGVSAAPQSVTIWLGWQTALKK